MRKTLEGGRPWRERAPLERGALSLQTSLSPENFPQEHPPLYGENLFRYVWAGALGESFLFLGRYFFAECGFAPVLCVGRIWRISFAWVLYPITLRPPIGRDSRTLQKFPPPIQAQKLPHKTPTIKKAKQNFARVMVGVLWGSSGRLREVWREKEHPPKGGSFSLQGLSIPYLLQDSPRTKRSSRKRSAGRTKVIIRTEETVPMPSRSPTVEIAFCVERK